MGCNSADADAAACFDVAATLTKIMQLYSAHEPTHEAEIFDSEATKQEVALLTTFTHLQT